MVESELLVVSYGEFLLVDVAGLVEGVVELEEVELVVPAVP